MNDYGYLFATFFAMMIISFGERALPFAAENGCKSRKWANCAGEVLAAGYYVFAGSSLFDRSGISSRRIADPRVSSDCCNISASVVLEKCVAFYFYRNFSLRCPV